MKLRQGTPADTSAWMLLRRLRWPWLNDPQHAQAMETILAHPNQRALLLAWEGEQCAAFMELEIYGGNHQTANISAWYCLPEFQSRQAGPALFELAQLWASSRGCVQLCASCEADNFASQRDLHQLGFRDGKRLIQFFKPLGNGDPAPGSN